MACFVLMFPGERAENMSSFEDLMDVNIKLEIVNVSFFVNVSKNEWSYTSTPPIRLHGMVLI
jgi:hypothetical protein